MATFNFSEADGTLLNAVAGGANWAGAATSLKTNAGLLVASSAFSGGLAWFVNGQGDTQSVQAVVDFTGTVAAEFSTPTLQTNGSQTGYRFILRADGDIDLERNGVFQTRLTGGGARTNPATIRADYVVGTGVISLSTYGVSRGTWTDGTPLTGGFPGLQVTNDSVALAPSMDNWTDFFTPAGGAALQDAEWHPMEPQTNPLTVSVW